jgi:hypothetical protein
MGNKVSDDRAVLVARLGARHAVLRVSTGDPSGRVHHKRHRKSEHAVTQNHQDPGHFPNDEAAIKLLWLALNNVLAKTVRAAFDWKSAMNQFAILFGDRFTQARG